MTGHAFRPAFSLELLRSHPYMGSFLAIRTSLLRKLAWMPFPDLAAAIYDLALKAAEFAQVIVHIPEVLYREPSTATPGQLPVLSTAHRDALEQHLQRSGEAYELVIKQPAGFNTVRYPLTAHRVAIVVPTKNHGDLLRQCLESIERTVSSYVNYDVVVIDHASNDPQSLAYFDSIRSQHLVLRYEGEFNFSAINNWAIAQLDGSYSHVLLCNNDIEAMHNGWLENMLRLALKSDVGVVGAKLYYADRTTIQHAGVCVGMRDIAEHYGKFMQKNTDDGIGVTEGYGGGLVTMREMSAVTAACALVRRDAFDAVSGFDEAIAVGFGDVDLCLRIRRAGFRVLFCPDAALVHHESLSRGNAAGMPDPHQEDSAYFLQRWQNFIDFGDPYYNPNLTLHNSYWSVKGRYELSHTPAKQFKRRIWTKSVVQAGAFVSSG